jgi:PAS domain S-box-containing protein
LAQLGVSTPLVQIGLLGEAIDGAPVAVLVSDDTGRYVAANRFACTLLGYTREELLRLSVTDVAVGDDVAAHYQNFVATGIEKRVQTFRRKNGETFELRYRAGRTTMAAMTYYVSVGVPLDDEDPEP